MPQNNCGDNVPCVAIIATVLQRLKRQRSHFSASFHAFIELQVQVLPQK